MMVGSHLGYKIGKFSHVTTNVHIYDRHFNAVEEMLKREPLDIQPSIRLKSNNLIYIKS